MARTTRMVGAGLFLSLLLGSALTMLPPAGAQSTEVCFAETSFCIDGAFRSFWERAGLATIGFPLSAAAAPPTPGSATAQQWFERHRLELHPANPQPYNLLLGRVGAERLAQLGRDWQSAPPALPQDGCRFFPETGHNLCPPFLAAWQSVGLDLDGQVGVGPAESLALFGLPLTEAQVEDVEGQPYTVQWFERARFELHQDGGTTRVLFGRLGAELLAGGAAVGGAPVSVPTAPAATATGVPPTSVAPTATRAPRRPTSTPEDEPQPTSPAEPSSTSAPQPTSTRLPTSTAAPPTSTSVPPSPTPVPPTPTPVPDPYDSPGTPPPGFNDSGGLPSASGGTSPLENFDAATDTRNIGGLICFQVDQSVGAPDFSGTQTFTVTTDLGVVVETGIVELDAAEPSVLWRWVPDLEYAPGVYRVSTAVSPTLTISGTLLLERKAVGAGRNLVVKRTDMAINLDDFNNCNDTIFGEPGDEFALVMTGFEANEEVPLYLYGTPGCTTTSPACFRGLLDTVTTDANGQAYLLLPTLPTYANGAYIILTEEQARAELIDNGSLQFQAVWYQRFNLR